MRKIYNARDPFGAHLVKDLLIENEIPAVIQGDQPYMSVWISESVDPEAAMRVVNEFEAGREARHKAGWKCETCGEHNDGSSDSCVKCIAFQREEHARFTRNRTRQFFLLLNIASAFLIAGIGALLYGRHLHGEIEAALEMFELVLFVASGVVFLWAMRTLLRSEK